MKLQPHAKFTIIVFIIIILTILILILNKHLNTPSIKEGLDGDAITDQIFGPFKSFSKTIESIGPRLKHMQQGFKNAGYGLRDEFVAIGDGLTAMGTDFADIVSGGGAMGPFLNEALKSEGDNINDVIITSNNDLTNFFNALPTAIDPYLVDTTTITASHPSPDGLFDRMSKYIKMYLMCGSKMNKNFMYCLIYYIVDVIVQTVYLMVIQFPLWLILTLSGLDLTCYVDLFFSSTDCLDEFWMGLTGYHLFHYSEYIMDKCYYCDGIPHKNIYDTGVDPQPRAPTLVAPPFPTNIQDSIDVLNKDFKSVIPARMNNIGKFLTNNVKTMNTDAIVSDDYLAAADNLKTKLGGAIDKSAKDFAETIPRKFGHATDVFNKAGDEFNAAFN